MIRDTIELAENKLLLLYIISKIPQPASRSGITQIVLENNLLNYFQMQQYIAELIDGGFIDNYKENNMHMITITSIGINALSFFENRIPDKKKEIIDTFLKTHNHEILKKDIESFAEYLKSPNDKYVVNLKLIKNEDLLLDLNLSAETKSNAEHICNTFEKQPEEIYKRIKDIFKD